MKSYCSAGNSSKCLLLKLSSHVLTWMSASLLSRAFGFISVSSSQFHNSAKFRPLHRAAREEVLSFNQLLSPHLSQGKDMIIKLSSFLTIYDDDSIAAELKKPLKLPILLPSFFVTFHKSKSHFCRSTLLWSSSGLSLLDLVIFYSFFITTFENGQNEKVSSSDDI